MNNNLPNSWSNDLLTKQSILIIDDSLDMLELGRTILEIDGFKVYTAASGNQALEILYSIKDLDLILLDINLNDMNGYALLRIINERNMPASKEAPVVFYTGVEDPDLSNADGFIRKNGDIERFLKEVHHFIDREKIVA